MDQVVGNLDTYQGLSGRFFVAHVNRDGPRARRHRAHGTAEGDHVVPATEQVRREGTSDEARGPSDGNDHREPSQERDSVSHLSRRPPAQADASAAAPHVGVPQSACYISSRAADFGPQTGHTQRVPAVSSGPSRPPARDLVVAVGADIDRAELWLGGDDWTADIGRRPRPAHGGRFGMGLQAGAVLIAAEISKVALAPLGMVAVSFDDQLVWNVLDYPLAPAADMVDAPLAPLRVAWLGTGSVGSSAAGVAACVSEPDGVADTVDGDSFDPSRNPFRYPASIGIEPGPKAIWVASLLARAGWDTRPLVGSVGDWVRAREMPGFDGIAVSSVDRVDGRLQVADVLAHTTHRRHRGPGVAPAARTCRRRMGLPAMPIRGAGPADDPGRGHRPPGGLGPGARRASSPRWRRLDRRGCRGRCRRRQDRRLGRRPGDREASRRPGPPRLRPGLGPPTTTNGWMTHASFAERSRPFHPD